MVHIAERFSILRIAAALCSVIVASGCANTLPVPTTVDVAGMPNPEIALQKSMRHVDAEMAQLGAMSTRATYAQPVVPAPLERTVDFTWSGPLDAGVAKLAQSVGYTFFTTKPPEGQVSRCRSICAASPRSMPSGRSAMGPAPPRPSSSIPCTTPFR